MKTSFLLVFCLCTYFLGTAQQVPRTDLITGFYQTNVPFDARLAKCFGDDVWGNCVAIAMIKAAAAEFGSYRAIYQDWKEDNNATALTFNDGLKLTLSAEELKIARRLCGFGIRPDFRDSNDVLVVYASMCKRIFLKKDNYSSGHCIQSFSDAVHFLNSGYSTKYAGDLLGLKMMRIKSSKLKNTSATIIHTGAHTAFCTYGIQDDQGTAHLIKRPFMRNAIGPAMLISKCYKLTKAIDPP